MCFIDHLNKWQYNEMRIKGSCQEEGMGGSTGMAAAVRRRRHRMNSSIKKYGDRIKIRYTAYLPPYRLGIILLQAAILLIAITNISVVVAQKEEILITSSPTPKMTNNDNNEGEATDQSISPMSPTTTTLAPFLPVTIAPIFSESPMTASPTISPSLPPAPLVPTTSPTEQPSYSPSISHRPSVSPSYSPTNFPTSTQQPTDFPSVSGAPSFPPSTSTPTVSPTPIPTYSPVPEPSGAPSNYNETSVIRNCEQILEVEAPEVFTEVQTGIYQLLMESYTANFGYEITAPQIVTVSWVLDQDLAGGRRRWKDNKEPVRRKTLLRKLFNKQEEDRNLQTTITKNLLVITFTMEYTSRYGYDVEDYPSQFQNYINSNLEQVTDDMAQRFLPVLEAQNVIVYKPKEPTDPPTTFGEPSSAPTLLFAPSDSPSQVLSVPQPATSPPSPPSGSGDQTNFIVGLAAGLGGAALIICFLIWNMRRKNLKKEEERRAARNEESARQQAIENEPQISNLDEGFEVSAGESGLSEQGGGGLSRQNTQDSTDIERTTSPAGIDTVGNSIFSNPSMVSGGGSFSSNPDDYPEGSGVQLDTLQDEFDNYKNQDLEYMRNGVEESVYGAEGMMSLAMTRALMDDEEVDINPSWGGAEDPESIEANGLCETNDWLRKNEHSTLDEINIFFQELLNRMVITVRRGMISPSDGTRAIHCCAAMLGLQLEKDLPNSVLLVHGMRKTNDLSLGRSYLVEAFKSFGDIEGAAIAPSNKGFGFVRFVSPKSVERALERFRISEIEVQDVSVMIKSLKGEVPSA